MTFPSRPAPVHQSVSWTAPTLGIIKVNIDGSFKSDKVRIGSIFRDHEDKPLLYFAKHVLVDLVIHVEILAVREGLHVVAASCWSSSSSFQFESGSSNAVSCCFVPSKAP